MKENQYRILLTAGGTGGHIFPALALAKELQVRYHCSMMFAAGNLSKNAYFQQDSFPYKDISCSKRLFLGAGSNLKGIVESIRLINSFNPDVIVGFGSYYTLPVLAASLILTKPILLHEANSRAGRVNRIFSPFAKKSWVFFPEAKAQLKGDVEECKMPLREQFRKDSVSKQEALAFFQLDQHLPTFLVFGGSQGAKGVNALFSQSSLLAIQKRLPPFQMIHFTGSNEEASILSKRYRGLNIPSCVKAFESRMDLAWAAADVAVTRAGASSIAEQCEYGIPGLVIPFPNATDGHQDLNADKLTRASLAIKVAEKELSPAIFIDKICSVFESRELRRLQFSQDKQKISNLDLSERIIDWLGRQ